MKSLSKRESQIRYILERCSPEPNSGCFLWTGGLSRKGRPVGILPYMTTIYPIPLRRVLWELTNQRPLGSLEIWSTCGTHSCLNLDHTEVIDPANQELSDKRFIGNKVRAWLKMKKRKARGFEEWRLKNNKVA